MSYGNQPPSYPAQGAAIPSYRYNQESTPPQTRQPPTPTNNPPNYTEAARARNTNYEDDDHDDYDPKYPGDSISQKYLNLEFEACFYEHENSSTYKQLYDVLGVVYKWVKFAMYHLLVVFLGIPIMLTVAILNAIMAFIYSWIWNPTLRLAIFWLAAALPLVTMPLVAIFKPLADVIARIFRQIRIKTDLNGQLYRQPV